MSKERPRKLKCELYRDSMQGWKCYPIQKAQLIIADVPYCYDTETECWTTDGWKKYTELTYDDTVLSINPKTMEMEYSGIENIIVRDNTEKMISFQNMNMDLLVTENHRMFAFMDRKPQGRGIRKRSFQDTDGIRLAKYVNGSWYVPRSGYRWVSHSDVTEIKIPSCPINTNGQEHIAKPVFIPLEKWLPFFGMWLADGCTCSNRGNNGRRLYRVSIKQAGEKRAVLREMLADFPFTVHEHKEKSRDMSNFDIDSKQLWLYLRQFGKSSDKYVPRWILDLPEKYLKILWRWYTFGDSHKNGAGLAISSVSQQLIQDMQEVALKLGTLSQIRTRNNRLFEFQFNPKSRNITYGSKKVIEDYHGKVWCITCKTNSVFLVRRNGKIMFCGNCVGNNFYGSNPMWYKGGDNKNGESKLAGKAAFTSDFNFNLFEYFHFCSRLMKKDDTKPVARGRSSNSPCMIVFCSFQQQHTLIQAAKKHGFVNYIPLTFIKNYSPQVLKANMRVVGATEHAILFYRDRLPKFRNGLQVDENGKNIRGTGHMVFDWFPWERDGKDIPKIHPAQKPVKVIKKLIETFTDPYDVVIDPCFGSGTTARACQELKRNFYGFEINKEFYTRAKNEMLLTPEELEKYHADQSETDLLYGT